MKGRSCAAEVRQHGRRSGEKEMVFRAIILSPQTDVGELIRVGARTLVCMRYPAVDGDPIGGP